MQGVGEKAKTNGEMGRSRTTGGRDVGTAAIRVITLGGDTVRAAAVAGVGRTAVLTGMTLGVNEVRKAAVAGGRGSGDDDPIRGWTMTPFAADSDDDRIRG